MLWPLDYRARQCLRGTLNLPDKLAPISDGSAIKACSPPNLPPYSRTKGTSLLWRHPWALAIRVQGWQTIEVIIKLGVISIPYYMAFAAKPGMQLT